MKPAARRLCGIALGLVLGGALVGWSATRELHVPGPMNTGHAKLACADCHRSAPGTLRQQLQNAARDAIGSHTQAPVDVGYRRVGNDECVACHERADDRHPTYRFLEPRFAEVRAELHPETCTACHREHQGVRVTTGDITFCRHCHGDTAIENDPLDISHRALVALNAWTTCLGCHDFHGNHAYQAPRTLSRALEGQWIHEYFRGGPSPYGEPTVPAMQGKVMP